MSGKQFVMLITVNRVGLERRQNLWEDLKKKAWATCVSGGEWYWSEGLRWAFLVCWRYLQSDWRWLDKELMQGKIKQGLPGNCNNTGFYSGRPYLIHILKGSDWLLWRNSECSYVTGISQDRSTGGLDEVSAPNQIHTNIGVFSAKRWICCQVWEKEKGWC